MFNDLNEGFLTPNEGSINIFEEFIEGDGDLKPLELRKRQRTRKNVILAGGVAANEFKEGDESLGLTASDSVSRNNARKLLSRASMQKMYDNPVYKDSVQQLIWNELDMTVFSQIKHMTIGDLKTFLLEKNEKDIKNILDGLTSHVVGSVVKIMSNSELGAVAKKINTQNRPNESGQIGYLGARIQPNSPSDDLDQIMLQVLDGFSYGVGDLILGTNPVDGVNILGIELLLKNIVEVFNISDILPWCVLGHIDDQYEVEVKNPGSTKVWFQSLAGTDGALKTFGVDIPKLLFYAEKRKEINNGYSFYFETGQGADFSNGHGNGFDMVIHEANKYSLAKILRKKAGDGWMIINDVAGFIGPEIFRTEEQLLRTVLEDTLMGKLNNLAIGLDICSTLHMDVSLDDLEEIQDQVFQISAPGYLMALPTRNDPMLGYLTTAFHDHLRIRHNHNLKINPKMFDFFVDLGVIYNNGTPTVNFGNPKHVYYKYLEKKGDPRFKNYTDYNTFRDQIYEEAESKISSAEDRNVFISEFYGKKYWNMDEDLKDKVEELYQDSKKSVWKDFSYGDLPTFNEFSKPKDGFIYLQTKSKDRSDYILHPSSGEDLDDKSTEKVKNEISITTENVILIISDGLNAYSITDKDHIIPFIEEFRSQVELNSRFKLFEKYLVVKYGRVRIGYEVGDTIFKEFSKKKGVIVNIIGERPGTGHHPFSVYMCLENGTEWSIMDHQFARVVASVSDTGGTRPRDAASLVMLKLDELYVQDG